MKLRKGCPGDCECSKSRIACSCHFSVERCSRRCTLYVVHDLGSVVLCVVLEIDMQIVPAALHSQGHDMFVVDVFMIRGMVPP
jgi:hypothetical protein